MNNSFISELEWRGLINNKTINIEQQLNKEMTTAYIGFDPTSDSLHIGSLIPIILLVHFQKFGHKPIALIGGATGMIGDPSGKNKERNLLTEETINYNLLQIEKQLSKYLIFDKNIPNYAEIVNNYDWTKEVSFLSFIRDIGKHITVNYMMAKDSVKKRLEMENGISFTEFTYQLLQGFDFYHLYKNKNCKLQMGGSDQWGNIITGTELIKKKLSSEAFAITCPLLTKSDGGKFGKSEQGNIWLDENKTSPYLFYQFWLNTSDEDAIKWIKIFTFLNKKNIEELIIQHNIEPHKRILQKELSKEITTFIHGEENYKKAIISTEILFGNGTKENLLNLKKEEFSQITINIPKVEIPKSKILNTILILDLLQETQIFPSKSEAKKMIQNGGISINKTKIDDLNTIISEKEIIFNDYILIQKGKKQYFIINLQ